MPRKKSIKHIADAFISDCDEIDTYISECKSKLVGNDKYISWIYDDSIIRLYRSFEKLMLYSLVGAINNNTAETIALKTGFTFPKHLSDEVCEYLVLQDSYFDFKGREGLIKEFKRFLPEPHWLITIIKDSKYKEKLEYLYVLRNYAAHESKQSRKAALKTIDISRMKSPGVWLKSGNNYSDISSKIRQMANEIKVHAPY